MRIAIAGLGSAARRGHLPALAASAPAAQLVAGADPDGDGRERFAHLHPDVPTFSSAAEMVSSVACDLLIVASEPTSHAELVTLAIDRGLHVVCEKPLSLTRAQHAAVAAAWAMRADCALVAVHQYRYSRRWQQMRRWARAAAHMRYPFTLAVDVDRCGTDRHAASPWRDDVASTGGLLADMGVHFLALGWTIHQHLDLLAAARTVDDSGRERAAAMHRLGPGVLSLRLWNGAPARRTRVELRLGGLTFDWDDGLADDAVGPWRLRCRRVDALTDRHHVDALYGPLYRELLAGVTLAPWRAYRTAEALAVSDALVTLLEHASLESR